MAFRGRGTVLVATAAPTAAVDIGDAFVTGGTGLAADAAHQHAFPAPSAGYVQDLAALGDDGADTTPARARHRHRHRAVDHAGGGFADLTSIYATVGSISGLLGINVKDPAYGAVGDGATNDRAAIAAADAAATAAGQPLIFPAGTYRVASNLTIANPVIMAGGAKLSIPTAVTVTINGTFSALPFFPLFVTAGTGKVAFADGALEEGYAEWWGAKANDGTADCLAAITAALTACPIVHLFGGDYYLSATLVITSNNRTLEGAGTKWNATPGTTRLVVKSATAATLEITPAVDPGTNIANFSRNVKVRDVVLTRTITPAPAAAGAETTGPLGLHLYKTFFCFVDRVDALEHQVGFCLDGTVQSHLTQCYSFRSLVGSGGTMANDIFWGYWLNGDASIGAAGGNASTYLTDCTTNVGLAPALVESAGIRLSSSFVDTFIIRLETTACDFGAHITGTAAGSAGAQKLGNVDLHLIGCVFDQFNRWGLYIKDLAPYAAVDVLGGYAAASAGADPDAACVQVDTSAGTVTLANFQGICWAQPTTFGLFVTNSSGVSARGNQWIGSARPVALTNANLNHLADVIRTPNEVPSEAAVVLNGTSSRNYIAPNVGAGANLFPIGVELQGASTVRNEINCTLIDAAAVTGGSANKLVINSVQVTAAGLSGTNLASGVMT